MKRSVGDGGMRSVVLTWGDMGRNQGLSTYRGLASTCNIQKYNGIPFHSGDTGYRGEGCNQVSGTNFFAKLVSTKAAYRPL